MTKISDSIGGSCSAELPINPAWNCQRVEDRMLEAAETLNCLADLIRHREHSAALMTTGQMQDSNSPALGLPDPNKFSRMREVLTWLDWLEPDVARLMWARAQGVSWKGVAYRFGLSVRTAQRQRRYALGVILWCLHDRHIPRKWSRQFLLARVAALSRGN